MLIRVPTSQLAPSSDDVPGAARVVADPVDPPHFAFPFRLAGNEQDGVRVATVTQDTTEEVAACVAVLLSYPQGFLDRDPEFGAAPDPFGEVDLPGLRAALSRWEPRVDTGGVELTDRDLERFVDYVRVQAQGVE